MKLLFDTNLWVRYFIKDDQQQFALTNQLIEANEVGNIQLYCSSIIFLELSFVLKRLYGFTFDELWRVMQSIRTIRGITILQDTHVDTALLYFHTYRLKFSDCLIASQLEEDMTLISFDEELRKVKELQVKTPQEIIKGMN